MSAAKKGITIRFEDSEMEELDKLAARFHVSSATIIRWALQALSDYVVANKGKITLPLDFSEFFQQAKASAEEHKPHLMVADTVGNELSRSTHADGASVKYPTRKQPRKKA